MGTKSLSLNAAVQFGTLYRVIDGGGNPKGSYDSQELAISKADIGKGDSILPVATLDLQGMYAINRILSTSRQMIQDLTHAARLLRKAGDTESTLLADTIETTLEKVSQ